MAMKILLADDSMTAQNMGKKILTDAGFEVIAVSNGAAALKKITAENPDIIILDVFMPGYTGLEVCERLKNNPETSRKPVLLTVGKMEPFNPDDSNRVRAEGVMIKPFEATDLTAAIEAIAKRFNIPRTTAAPPPPPPPPKAPQNFRSYEETVMLSQDELRQSLGIADEATQTAAAASAAGATSAAAVAVAPPALELDSSAIVTEQEAVKPIEAVPAMEFDPPSRTAESEHSPFSHASVAREVVEHPAAPVQETPTADWDPVLDGIAISSNVITTAPEAAQAAEEAQPMFGLEYAVPASVAKETPVVAEEEAAVEEPMAFSSPAHSAEEETEVSSPSAYLAEASAAMGLETSHALVEEIPVVESAPDFEPNVAPPVQVETHAENGVEPGIEQPSPELTVPPDPALVGGTDSFSDFTTRFGIENAEVIPVGIVPELMEDASSSYEYQPPEEGHAFEGDEAEPVAEEAKSEDMAQSPTPVAVSSAANMSWEMVPVEAAAETSAPIAATPEPAAAEADTESTSSVQEEPARFEPMSAAVVEESAPDTHVVQAAVDESPVVEASVAETPTIEAVEKPFDPDATQALPEEFFTQSEPQLETTAELVGASLPESTVEALLSLSRNRRQRLVEEPSVVEEPSIEEHIVTSVVEAMSKHLSLWPRS